MRMLGNLFIRESIVVDEKDAPDGHLRCVAVVAPDMGCEVLKAHFPGRPVVPGACLLATVNELICRVLQQDCHVASVKNIKFISLIEPDGEEPVTIEVDIDVPTMMAKALITYKETLCCKMSLTCTTAS